MRSDVMAAKLGARVQLVARPVGTVSENCPRCAVRVATTRAAVSRAYGPELLSTLTVNQGVAGSSPARGANSLNYVRKRFYRSSPDSGAGRA
jgi:hypothetical protein